MMSFFCSLTNLTKSKQERMEDIVNRIVAYAKQQAKELSLQDQALVYQELEGRMSDLNLQALHDDYLADGLYC